MKFIIMMKYNNSLFWFLLLCLLQFFFIQTIDGTVAIVNEGQSNDRPYLLQQGRDSEGGIFLFSPYFLWNPAINENASELTTPLALRSVNGHLDITLIVNTAIIETEVFTFTSRLFCFNSICRAPGPSLYLHPGDTLHITLINNLQNTSGIASVGPKKNSKIYSNCTNIFIQGLNLDPSINNPYRLTWGGGDQLIYEYIIPHDAAVGMHWYYSRVPGISAMQVMGGLYGALIIEYPPSNTLLPNDLAVIHRQLLIFSHIFIKKSSLIIEEVRNQGFSLIDEGYKNSSLSFEYLSNASGSTLPLNTTLHLDDTYTDIWLTNGNYQPFYSLQPGEWRIFDILIASGDRILELEVRTEVGYGAGVSVLESGLCEIRLLALDGVYLNESRTGSSVNHLIMLQSSRASIAMMCHSSGTYYLQSVTSFNSSSKHYGIGDYQTKSNQNLLTITISGTTYIMDPPPTDLTSIPRPSILADLMNVSADDSSEAWSISTAQGGCCSSTTAGTSEEQLCAINDGVVDILEDSSTPSSFWLGVGSDCRPACYEPILCSSLYGIDPVGAIAAVSVEQGGGGYSVEAFPTTRKGSCQYSSFPGYLNYHQSITAYEGCHTLYKQSFEDESTIESVRNVSQLFESSTTLTAGTTITTGLRQEILLYGHEDFSYPIFLQGHSFQLGEFTNVDKSISNIIASSDYTVTGSIDSSMYASVGDWKEVWPSLTGKSVLYTSVLDNSDTSLLILTPFLKFGDAGFTRNIIVFSAANVTSENIMTNDSSIDDTMNPLSTAQEEEVTNIPRSAELDSDSAAEELLCDVNGGNFSYTELLELEPRLRSITFNSCPNHFSLCQDNQCGGEMKTRALIRPNAVKIPLYPGIAARDPLDTTCNNELLGVALNGVGFYGSSDGHTDSCDPDTSNNYTLAVYGRTSCRIPGRYDGIRYCGDAVREFGTQFDKCGGVSARDGIYKYYIAPVCLQQQQDEHRVVDHSPQLGWALDGFPIYGEIGAKGIIMQRCGTAGAHPVLCLDVCNGYYGKLPGYDQFMYRYYLPGNSIATGKCASFVQNGGECERETEQCCISNIPTKIHFPYTIGCFKGCPINDETCILSSIPGVTDDYIPSLTNYPHSIIEDVNTVTRINDNVTSNHHININSSSHDNSSSSSSNVINQLRSVLKRNEFNNELILTSYNTTTAATAATTIKDVIMIEEVLSRSIDDVYFTGFVLDELTNIIYYTTQSAIFSYHLQTKETKVIISGFIEVHIQGYNLGENLIDILSITINNKKCGSLIHLSSKELKCSLLLKDVKKFSTIELLSKYTPETVEIITIGGKTKGIALNPLSIIRSGSGRPVITYIDINPQPFFPYTVALISHQPTIEYRTHVSSTDSYEQTIYWSNWAYGAYSIQRCRVDGSHVETIINNVQKAIHMITLPVLVDSNMKLLEFIHHDMNLSTLTSCIISPSIGAMNSIIASSKGIISSSNDNCSDLGHYLLFIDSNQEVLTSSIFYPISSIEIFQSYSNKSDSLNNTKYVSSYLTQETNDGDNMMNSFIQHVKLIGGLTNVRSFSLDMNTREMFMSFMNGIILRYNFNILLNSMTTEINLNIPQILGGNKKIIDQLPSWITVIARLPTRSRLEGLCVFPQSSIASYQASYPLLNNTSMGRNEYDLQANVIDTWNQQRILVADANQHALYGVTESGSPITSLELGRYYGTYFPHQLICLPSALEANSNNSSEEDEDLIVYIAEYIGRIWKAKLKRRGGTMFEFQETRKPELILDRSSFAASIRLREILNTARSTTGQPLYESIFYEVR